MFFFACTSYICWLNYSCSFCQKGDTASSSDTSSSDEEGEEDAISDSRNSEGTRVGGFNLGGDDWCEEQSQQMVVDAQELLAGIKQHQRDESGPGGSVLSKVAEGSATESSAPTELDRLVQNGNLSAFLMDGDCSKINGGSTVPDERCSENAECDYPATGKIEEKRLGPPVKKKRKKIRYGWTEALSRFVTNGLFREQKVIFQERELAIGSPIFKRVKLQFEHGMECPDWKVVLDPNSEKVKGWWAFEARKVISDRINHKKANALWSIKIAMKGKCWWMGWSGDLLDTILVSY